jgi:hypothetical protein
MGVCDARLEYVRLHSWGGICSAAIGRDGAIEVINSQGMADRSDFVKWLKWIGSSQTKAASASPSTRRQIFPNIHRDLAARGKG